MLLKRLSRKITKGFLVYSCLLLAGGLMLIPLLWMLSTSLKDVNEVFKYPPKFIPTVFKPMNYINGLSTLPFGRYVLNTLSILLLSMFGGLCSSTLVGYGFARLKAPGKELLFMFVLATMMIPFQVTMIPMFIVFQRLGWIDTFKPLIVPSFFGIPVYIFLFRQFFKTIPKDFDEAAKIDGCSMFGTFWRIMLPLAKPVIAVVMMFQFIFGWNDFTGPLIYLMSPNKRTFALGLYGMVDTYNAEWNLIMAVAVVALVPCVLIFLLAQRKFTEGVVMMGLKG
ncbi:MAG: carbohydrate ABC transporter permease [Patescibacteria group bacterium]